MSSSSRTSNLRHPLQYSPLPQALLAVPDKVAHICPESVSNSETGRGVISPANKQTKL